MNDDSGSGAGCRRRVLITGATDGLGRATSLALVRAGCELIVHGRSAERVETIRQEALSAGAPGVTSVVADLALLRDVRRMLAAVQNRGEPPGVVVNNAGVGFGDAAGGGRVVSGDGIELRLAVNYLAPMVLTYGLLPILAEHAGSRVVQVASIGQHPLDLADLESREGFDLLTAYRRSKLALIAGSLDLADRVNPSMVTINCVHPATYMPAKMVVREGVAAASTVDDGLAAVVRLVVGTGLTGRTGLCFEGLSEASPHAQAHDPAARQTLRAWTDRFVDTSLSQLSRKGSCAIRDTPAWHASGERVQPCSDR
jgi:NAD(P)-dependent dehydrogenase (short-subunit alcohol dehydrogenase family)